MILILMVTLLAGQLVHGDSCTSEYSCASCTTVRICHQNGQNTTSGYQQIYQFTCPPATPYCTATGTCSTLPTLGCGPTDTFPCIRDGVFPNPTDCSKYRVCQNGTSYVYSCPSSYNFNSDQRGCVRSATCYIINCAGKDGVKVAYGNDPAIFAYCQGGIAVCVDRCLGSYKMNYNTQKCGPSCPSVGYKIPDADNCTGYFYCTKEPYASDYTTTRMLCPSGYGFDPRGLRCVPLQVLPYCTR